MVYIKSNKLAPPWPAQLKQAARYNIYNVMWEASEEEDPLDPLSDAIFHPKPRGLILLCRRFVEMETLFVKILDNTKIL